MTGTTPIDTIIQGDCLEEMKKLPDRSIDAIVTDPPAGINFMQKSWDGDKGGRNQWIAWMRDIAGECLRVIKPGGHALVWALPRTSHWTGMAWEEAGWEPRDKISHVFGCLSDDTEILIDGAWSHYRKCDIGSLTLCYNNETDSYSWQPIQEVFEYRIKDTAYRIQSDLTDQIVTRNHRCLVEREGKILFCLAEEAAQKHEICVPTLESLQGLCKDFSLHESFSGRQKQSMLTTLRRGSSQNNDTSTETARCNLSALREDIQAKKQCVSQKREILHAEMQCNPSIGESRRSRTDEENSVIGPGWLVGRNQEKLCSEDNRAGEPLLEGRCNLLQDARELSGREICSLSSEISINGSKRRLCDGASYNSCTCNKAMSEEVRGRASYQPRSDRQPLRESSAIQDQSGPQEIRGAGITRTTLARIAPIEYDGIVWCVRVPTGAFVARRNGKIFVTGNSGFPKSLDISKKLDQMAGAEREVIGVREEYAARANKKPHSNNSTVDGFARPGEIGQITAPATPAAKQWAGWGSSLKPAHEDWWLFRAPLDGCTIAENVLRWGCGGLNVDACRIGPRDRTDYGLANSKRSKVNCFGEPSESANFNSDLGRFPSNLIHDGSPEVLQLFPQSSITGKRTAQSRSAKVQATAWLTDNHESQEYTDSGSASRFFMACEFTPADYAPIVYYAKASRSERERGLDGMPDKERGQRYGLDAGGYLPQQTPHKHEPAKNFHPTVKPLALMRYLCRLITPPGGIILDPFGGSGTTGLAAMKEGFHYILIEKEPEYCEIARKRIAAVPARLEQWGIA